MELKRALTKRFSLFGLRSGSMYMQSPDKLQDSPDPTQGGIIRSGKKNQMMTLGLDERVQKKKTKARALSPQLNLVAEQNISFDDWNKL